MPQNQWQTDLWWVRVSLQWRENARHICFSHLISQISALENAQVHNLDDVNQLIHKGCLELDRVDSLPNPIINRTLSFDSLLSSCTSLRSSVYTCIRSTCSEVRSWTSLEYYQPSMKQILSNTMTFCQILADDLPSKKQRLSNAMTFCQILADNPPSRKKRLSNAMTFCQILVDESPCRKLRIIH